MSFNQVRVGESIIAQIKRPIAPVIEIAATRVSGLSVVDDPMTATVAVIGFVIHVDAEYIYVAQSTTEGGEPFGGALALRRDALAEIATVRRYQQRSPLPEPKATDGMKWQAQAAAPEVEPEDGEASDEYLAHHLADTTETYLGDIPDDDDDDGDDQGEPEEDPEDEEEAEDVPLLEPPASIRSRRRR